MIEPSFAGDDEIGLSDAGLELDGVGNGVEAGLQAGSAERDQAGGEAASGAGAGEVGDLDVEIAIEDGCIVGERAFELGDAGRIGALLRAVDGARALWAEQRVLNVAEDADVDALKSRIDSVQLDAGEIGEGGATGWESQAAVVKQGCAERFGHAGAAVVGGAAADTDQDAVDLGLKGVVDELADAVCGSATRVEITWREQGESGGGGHFDHGAASVVDPTPTSINGCAERSIDARDGATAVRRLQESVNGARSAVGQRREIDGGVRECIGDSLLDSGCGLHGGQRALELLRRDEDAHASEALAGDAEDAQHRDDGDDRSPEQGGESDA